MTSPSAIGGVGAGASLAGGLLSAFGAEKAGQATQQMDNYKAAVAQINSKIDLQNADYAVNQGEQQSLTYGLKEAQTMGTIRTSEAASGIDVNSGSASQVQASQRTIAGIDTTTIRSNAAKVAFDYDTKSVMDLNDSTLDTMAGINAKTAGDINAASSIIGTVGSVSSKWLSGKQSGLFGSSSNPTDVGSAISLGT
jgi:hypothetical protein